MREIDYLKWGGIAALGQERGDCPDCPQGAVPKKNGLGEGISKAVLFPAVF